MAQNGMFTATGVIGPETLYDRVVPTPATYPRIREAEITEALSVAWLWLEINMLFMPAVRVRS